MHYLILPPVTMATLTCERNLPGSLQIRFVAHEDDGNGFGLFAPLELKPEFVGLLEAPPVRHGVDQEIRIPCREVLFLLLLKSRL